jgi:hypothetical protein
MSEEQSGDVLRLRKLNRIPSIQASTAIETMKLKSKGRKAIADVTVNVPVNVPMHPLAEKVCILLRANPKAIILILALTLGVTDRTIKRALKSLQESGIIRRVGARKKGHWEIIRPPVEKRRDAQTASHFLRH